MPPEVQKVSEYYEANKEEFVIHAIWQKSAEGIISGEMQRKVKKIEGDVKELEGEQNV